VKRLFERDRVGKRPGYDRRFLFNTHKTWERTESSARWCFFRESFNDWAKSKGGKKKVLGKEDFHSALDMGGVETDLHARVSGRQESGVGGQ